MIRGEHEKSLADDCIVFRCVRAQVNLLDGRRVGPSPEDFQLSDADKAGTPPHLSVWETRLTGNRDAELVQEIPTLAAKTGRLFLRVSDVRSVAVDDVRLDVLWTHWERLAAPGGPAPPAGSCLLGHAGIVGPLSSSHATLEGRGRSEKKNLSKMLRQELARIARRQDDFA
jgi:hypothetical protein